jgi:hypothetical protein
LSCYNPSTSIFAGMSTAQLQAALASAQQAYLDLSTGAKVQAATYTQADGSKSVTYTRADLGALTALIKQLQAQLGIITRPRRPIGFRFR